MIAAARRFGGRLSSAYDALISSQDRRSIQSIPVSNDAALDDKRRPKAIATAQDLCRNYSTAGWAVRKHTDFVARQVFKPETGDPDFNRALAEFMKVWGMRQNCDVRRQLGLRQITRLSEIRRTIDGDVAAMKIGGRGPDRGRLQVIEGARIITPVQNNDLKIDTDQWVNGFNLNSNGSVRRYALHTMPLSSRAFEFERFVPVRNMCWLSYREGLQYRGVSPLMSALNSFQDVYEGTQHHLTKMKAAATVALSIFRDSITDDLGKGRIKGYMDSRQTGVPDSYYRQEFGPGVNKMEMLPGDRAEWMTNPTPASETVAFMQWVLSLAVKSLDLPDTFLREQDGTFFSNRAAWNSYKRTAAPKQQDVSEWLDDITRWRIGMAIADGNDGPPSLPALIMPRGMQFSDIRWTWSALGYEWGNTEQEARGALTAIAGGLDNPERVAQDHGTDFRENIRKTIESIKFADELAAEAGVDFTLSTSPTFPDPESEFPREEAANAK